MLYPGATWLGPSPNSGGPMGAVRLGVIHIMEGTLAGTDSWFMNPQAQVSAHFGVGKNGEVHQYVDTSVVAWAEADYNDEAISIEHEGNSGDSLTAAQITADRALVRWIGLPLVMSTTLGWCGHGQLGILGGNHPDCPGQPILDQWPTTVLNDVIPTTLPEEGTMIARNTNGQGYWCVRKSGATYAFQGAPVIGPAQHFLTQWGIGTATNPVVGIVDDGQGGFMLEADDDQYPGVPALYHVTGDGQYKT